MYLANDIAYIQLQKTGSTHVALLLSKIFDGKQIGKHNAATKEQINSNRLFVASIRNPWDWYLSLWTYGVQGKGALRGRLTNKLTYGKLLKLAIKNPRKNFPMILIELSKDVGAWRSLYSSSDDAKSFREWLSLIHKPDNKLWLKEGYENTAIAEFCGFMSYRYLYLCCSNTEALNDQKLISNYEELARFEEKNCYIDHFIRQESTEYDLIKILEKIRPLTQEEKNIILGAKKTNTSKRSLPISEYYDRESIELVRVRERLLIEKFNYSPPNIASV